MALLKFEDVALAATEKFAILNGFKEDPSAVKTVITPEQELANLIKEFGGCAEMEARAVFTAMLSYCMGKKISLPTAAVEKVEKGLKNQIAFVKYAVVYITANPNQHNYPVTTNPAEPTFVIVMHHAVAGDHQEARGRIASGAEGNWLPTSPKGILVPATPEQVLEFCKKASRIRSLIEK